MIIPAHCPECDSPHTERDSVEATAYSAYEDRECLHCGAAYTIKYGRPQVDSVKVPEEAE
jgi:Zn ribbon nucleic-acid-binding protein